MKPLYTMIVVVSTLSLLMQAILNLISVKKGKSEDVQNYSFISSGKSMKRKK